MLPLTEEGPIPSCVHLRMGQMMQYNPPTMLTELCLDSVKCDLASFELY